MTLYVDLHTITYKIFYGFSITCDFVTCALNCCGFYFRHNSIAAFTTRENDNCIDGNTYGKKERKKRDATDKKQINK